MGSYRCKISIFLTDSILSITIQQWAWHDITVRIIILLWGNMECREGRFRRECGVGIKLITDISQYQPVPVPALHQCYFHACSLIWKWVRALLGFNTQEICRCDLLEALLCSTASIQPTIQHIPTHTHTHAPNKGSKGNNFSIAL